MIIVVDPVLLLRSLLLFFFSQIQKSARCCISALEWNPSVLLGERRSQYPPCQFTEGIPHQVIKEELMQALRLDRIDTLDASELQAVRDVVLSVFSSPSGWKGTAVQYCVFFSQLLMQYVLCSEQLNTVTVLLHHGVPSNGFPCGSDSIITSSEIPVPCNGCI